MKRKWNTFVHKGKELVERLRLQGKLAAYGSHAALMNHRRGLRAKLGTNVGSFLTDHAFAIVITVVAAAALIGGVMAVYNNIVLPGMESNATDFMGMANR